MSKTKHPPACVDCKWHERLPGNQHACRIYLGEPGFDPVLGQKVWPQQRIDAYVARAENGACGPDGKLFEKMPVLLRGERSDPK